MPFETFAAEFGDRVRSIGPSPNVAQTLFFCFSRVSS